MMAVAVAVCVAVAVSVSVFVSVGLARAQEQGLEIAESKAGITVDSELAHQGWLEMAWNVVQVVLVIDTVESPVGGKTSDDEANQAHGRRALQPRQGNIGYSIASSAYGFGHGQGGYLLAMGRQGPATWGRGPCGKATTIVVEPGPDGTPGPGRGRLWDLQNMPQSRGHSWRIGMQRK